MPTLRPQLFAVVLLVGFQGTDGVSTVSSVAVKRGGSVTIPCLYDRTYQNHVKYWCRGQVWFSCTPIVRSDSPKKTDKVSIRDDPAQRVFTVTMKGLQQRDSGYYWCAVEIGGPESKDDSVRLYLTVTGDTPGLSVDSQEVTSMEGDSVSVRCRYGNSADQLKWCKSGGSCVGQNSGNLDGMSVLIKDDTGSKSFTVTLGGLKRKDTGWYWCAAEDLQIPVHITVTQRTTAANMTSTTAGEANTGGVTFLCLLLTTLGVSVPLVAIVTWKVWGKRKPAQVQNQDEDRRTSNPTSDDYEVMSSVVMKCSAAPEQLPVVPANEIIYSSVVK